MADLPITTFTSLKISSPTVRETNTNTLTGTFTVAKISADQRQTMLEAGTVENGTIVCDSTTNIFYFYQNNSWQAFPATLSNVLTFNDATKIGAITSGQFPVFSNDGAITVSASTINNNNIVTYPGDATAITAGQVVTFSANKALTVQGATDVDTAKPITIGGVPLTALADNPKVLARQKDPSALPTIDGFSGLEIIDFDDNGYISLNERQFISLNVEGNQQSVLITDDQTSSTIDSYGAILSLRSTQGAFLLPRMNTVQKNLIPNQLDGMMVYDSTVNDISYHKNGAWENVTPPRSCVIFRSTTTVVWPVPAGVTQAKVTLIGGGGAGGGSVEVAAAGLGSGGGSGATTIAWLNNMSGTVNITVGRGSNGGTKSATATTYLFGSTTLTANAGADGTWTTNVTNALYARGGDGAAASTQPTNSAIVSYLSVRGGYGDPCFQYVGVGVGDTNLTVSGRGGDSMLGGGGGAITAVGPSADSNGIAGSINSGSGGSGGFNVEGDNQGYSGVGADGICIIEY